MLASSFFDPMLGIDIHWEMVPMPAPVPTPIPNPFTGIVKDFAGLAVGLALSNAIGMAMGGSPKGPVLYWGGIPATNTGTNGEHVPGHILIPPGTAWAPVPKTPKPVVRPNETPKPPKPVSPDNDAIIVFGSKTVSVMGTNAVRMGDIALSCSEPVRLPSTVVMAVPKGRPILIGGPMSLDIMAAIFASLRTRFISDSLHAGISRLPIGARGRAVLSWIACKLTGHPVDVASGKMMTRALDAELPGPLPLMIERFYLSNFASRRGPLGNGWSCSLDQAVWEERGKVVLLAEDGREIEFDTFDFPDHRMRSGDEVWNAINRLTLRCEAIGKWRVTSHDGVYREFASVLGKTDGRARIQRIVSRCENHQITFTYDVRSRLERVSDSAGRLIGIEQDEHDRIIALKLPHPHQSGWYVHRRYEYDSEGDLVRAVDSLGNTWSFEYVTHLMVRETDRTGLSFYFEYDGLGDDAWCTRTWGDGGIYDHVINYDKRGHVTYVTNSLGHTKRYHMNQMGLVVKEIDQLGGETQYEYDPTTFQRTKETDPLGNVVATTYDARGNVVQISKPDGAAISVRYDGAGHLAAAVDALGGMWRWQWDSNRNLSARETPSGERTSFVWHNGLLVRISNTIGPPIEIEYDGSRCLTMVRKSGGVETRCLNDHLGRIVEITDPRGAVTRVSYDLEGRITAKINALGERQTFRYDPEGNLVVLCDATRHVIFRYGHFHRLMERGEAGTMVRFTYDTEGRPVSIVNECGERYLFTYDAAGRVEHETTFDGRAFRHERDPVGRITRTVWASGRWSMIVYDTNGRVTRVGNSDGTFAECRYRADDALVEAKNESGALQFDCDAMGHPLREMQAGCEVRSTYRPDGVRSRVETSLGARCAIDRDTAGAVSSLLFSRLTDQKRDGARIDFQRDPMGAEIGRGLPGAVQIEWHRDVLGRPTERRATHLEASYSRRSEVQTYLWRGSDQIERITDSLAGTRVFDHDARGRLVREHRSAAEARDDASAAGSGSDSARWSEGPGGRVEQNNGFLYDYDEDGRLRRKITPEGEVWSYRWNGHGLLREVERPDGLLVRFEYDPFARRTCKKHIRIGLNGSECVELETRFVWDGQVVIHELSRDSAPMTWYWEPGTFTPVAKVSGDGVIWTVATDHLGTPTQLRDENGSVAWQMTLDTAGVPQFAIGKSTDCPWRWPGQYADPEVGLCYNRYRYYDPAAGRYISPDPLGPAAGTQLYAYVPDPVFWIDPLGLIVLQQVPYNEHPLFEGAGGVKDYVSSANKGTLKGRNVAVVQLADGTLVPAHSLGSGAHSEVVLLGKVDPAQVVAVYTERTPCTGRTNCLGQLESELGKDVPVYYTFEMIKGQEGKTAQEIEKARKQHCG